MMTSRTAARWSRQCFAIHGIGHPGPFFPAYPGDTDMNARHLRRRRKLVVGCLLISASAAVLGARASLAEPADPAEACRNLAALTKFPVAATEITLAQF